MKCYCKYFFFPFIILFFPGAMLLAQVESKGLIFDEVHLDKNQPAKSWIEIYNPTENPLILEAIRYSHIKTTNMLPDSIRGKGGIVIKPGEYLILAPEREGISSLNKTKNIILPILANFDSGGFMALTTKGFGSSGIDIIRYGDTTKSINFKEFKDKPIINFSANGKSFSRKLIKNNGVITISDFYETESTKGSTNK